VPVRVLVAEDDRKLAGLVTRGLREAGMVVDTVHRGDDALEAGCGGDYDAVVLDVMMPGLDGFAVCRGLREARVRSPVLLLTARVEVEDRIRGLDGGADDYMPKPFSMDELAARLRALARRGPIENGLELVAGDLRLDPAGGGGGGRGAGGRGLRADVPSATRPIPARPIRTARAAPRSRPAVGATGVVGVTGRTTGAGSSANGSMKPLSALMSRPAPSKPRR
jgi:CheY-like chemotaxis protein